MKYKIKQGEKEVF